MLKRPRLFWIVGMISAWLADFLFWKNQPGITVVVWVVLTIVAGIVIIRKEGVKPAFPNIALMILAIAMGCILALRQEPFTRFVASCLMLLALMLFTFSYQKAYWILLSCPRPYRGIFFTDHRLFGKGGYTEERSGVNTHVNTGKNNQSEITKTFAACFTRCEVTIPSLRVKYGRCCVDC